MKLKTVFTLTVLSVCSLVSIGAFASDADKEVADAKAAYDARSTADLTSAKDAAAHLEKALTLTTDADLKFSIQVLKARVHYFLGTFAEGSAAKLDYYQKGMDAATAAQKLDSSLAEGFYFYAINLGGWAQTKGIMESLGRAPELKKATENAMKLDTADGKPGESLDGYGPHRVLGRMYFKLPPFAGGNRDAAVKELDLANSKAPDYLNNLTYLAEALMPGGPDEQAKAKALLRSTVGKTVSDYNKDRKPETAKDLDRAKELLKDIGG